MKLSLQKPGTLIFLSSPAKWLDRALIYNFLYFNILWEVHQRGHLRGLEYYLEIKQVLCSFICLRSLGNWTLDLPSLREEIYQVERRLLRRGVSTTEFSALLGTFYIEFP